jgi:hypothetical protein
MLLPWRWMQHVPLKRQNPPTKLHGITSHKTTVIYFLSPHLLFVSNSLQHS